MGMIFGIYLLSCLPGLIAALLVRRWAKRQEDEIDRSTRALLVAATIGLLCSPGLYASGNGAAVVVLVIPSLLGAILAGTELPRVWLLFFVSSAVTTAITFGMYMAMSQPDNNACKPPDT